jgi:hypothetical protein
LDTAIIVGVVMGSVVAIALVFGKTVLGVAWTAKRVTLVENANKNNIIQQHIQDKNDVSIKETSNLELSRAADKLISSQVEKPQDLDSLLNKEVTTCDNVAIGHD